MTHAPNAEMGLFQDMPSAAYHALPHVSRSDLALVLRSPQHYRQAKGFPVEPTPAMRFGSALHAHVLEGEALAARPEGQSRRSKAGKEEYEAWTEEQIGLGNWIVSADDGRKIEDMTASIAQCPAAQSLLLDGTQREESYLWRDQDSGLAARCRPDAVNFDHGLIVDLKSTTDCTLFASSCYKFGYHLQASWYLDGVNETLRQMGEPLMKGFAFVAVEKTAPYGVLAAVLDAEDIERGRQAYKRAATRLAYCLKNDQWPGYSAKLQGLSLPRWCRRQHDDTYDIEHEQHA